MPRFDVDIHASFNNWQLPFNEHSDSLRTEALSLLEHRTPRQGTPSAGDLERSRPAAEKLPVSTLFLRQLAESNNLDVFARPITNSSGMPYLKLIPLHWPEGPVFPRVEPQPDRAKTVVLNPFAQKSAEMHADLYQLGVLPLEQKLSEWNKSTSSLMSKPLPDIAQSEQAPEGKDKDLKGKEIGESLDVPTLNRELFKTIGLGVSKEFQLLVQKTIEEMPLPVKKILKGGGYTVLAAGTVCEALPHLRMDHPRGWPPGVTWDHTDGTQNYDKRAIVVSERFRSTKTGVEWEAADRTAGVLRHESGHAIDRLLGTNGTALSESDGFKVAYERDLIGITPADRKVLSYHLQPGVPGRSETFADVFAVLIGGPCNQQDAEVLKRAFPVVAKFVKEKVGLKG
jgi:hypothetical protein